MIFLTTGSYGFSKLIKVVDELVGRGEIQDNVLAQISGSKYIPKHIEYFKYRPNINKYMEDADFVITHGGVGTILELANLGKKIIAVANRDLADDHQYQLLKKLEKQDVLLFCSEPTPDLLLTAIDRSIDFMPSGLSIFSDGLLSDLLENFT
jgi:UDP-N-acetylglucosamine transferase subunit ALG13